MSWVADPAEPVAPVPAALVISLEGAPVPGAVLLMVWLWLFTLWVWAKVCLWLGPVWLCEGPVCLWLGPAWVWLGPVWLWAFAYTSSPAEDWPKAPEPLGTLLVLWKWDATVLVDPVPPEPVAPVPE